MDHKQMRSHGHFQLGDGQDMTHYAVTRVSHTMIFTMPQVTASALNFPWKSDMPDAHCHGHICGQNTRKIRLRILILFIHICFKLVFFYYRRI